MNPAVDAWRGVLGTEKVDDSAGARDRYARSTQPDGTRPCCILFPTETAEVQAIVRIANEQRIPIYPLSRGKNWGYGDACAPVEGSAIVDLSRMNRIVEVNTELAYAVIEPGVSQGELFRHLQENKTGLWMDCTGAGPEASLVGNTVDRGFGHTRYGDHFATACGMEVVLPNGDLVHTGFGHYPGAKATRVYPYGVGPYLDGLFCQSNYGIVTKLGLWLMPKPEEFCFFYITCEGEDDIARLVDALRPLRMAGLVPAALHIGNDLRMMSGKGRYPWELTGGKTPLPDSVRKQIRAELGIGAWNCASALTGTRAQVSASRKALREALRPLGGVRFMSERKYAIASNAIGFLNRFGLAKNYGELMDSVRLFIATLKGEPTYDAIRGTHWRLRTPPGDAHGDPLEYGAGLIWISPVLPMTGRDAKNVLSILGPIFERYQFELLATFTMINERAMVGIFNVVFDKSDADESARATECYHASTDALIKEGYIPYRVSPMGMPKLAGEDDPFWRLASTIKSALDPNGIMAPGRYVPSEGSKTRG